MGGSLVNGRVCGRVLCSYGLLLRFSLCILPFLVISWSRGKWFALCLNLCDKTLFRGAFNHLWVLQSCCLSVSTLRLRVSSILSSDMSKNTHTWMSEGGSAKSSTL